MHAKEFEPLSHKISSKKYGPFFETLFNIQRIYYFLRTSWLIVKWENVCNWEGEEDRNSKENISKEDLIKLAK